MEYRRKRDRSESKREGVQGGGRAHRREEYVGRERREAESTGRREHRREGTRGEGCTRVKAGRVRACVSACRTPPLRALLTAAGTLS